MKEIEVKNSDKIESVKQTKIQKKTVLMGTVLPHNGHKCFEYNYQTNTISVAKFHENNADYEAAMKKQVTSKKKVMMREHCIYCTALNAKSSIKKFEIMLNRSVIHPTILK